MSNGKTYEIICKRGLNRIECQFKKQDPYLCCAECSFAGFKIRTPIKQSNNESKQPDIQQQD